VGLRTGSFTKRNAVTLTRPFHPFVRDDRDIRRRCLRRRHRPQTNENRNDGRTRAGPGLIQGRVATGWSRAVTLTVL
jgi:hypothetical protein